MLKTKTLNKTMTTILITLLTLSMLLAVIPMASAAIAVPTVSPVSGPLATVVTVSGAASAASAGGLVEVYWENLAGTKLNQTYAIGDGSYSCNVIIPEGYQGAHWLVVKDVTTGATAASKFSITPTLTLTPTSGISGDTISAAGKGFSASSQIAIFFDTPKVRLAQSGSSTAAWATDPGAAASLVNMVKLVGATGADSRVSVFVPAGTTLDTFDPTLVSYDYNGTAGTKFPDLELRFEHADCIDPDDGTSTNRAHVDITLQSSGTISTSDTWDTSPGYTEDTLVFAFGNKPETGEAFTLTTQNVALSDARTDLAGKVAGIGDWVLTRISPQVGWSIVGTYYIDNIDYDGTAYNLEPPIKNATTNTAGSFTTTFTVPPGATTGVKTVSALNVTDLFATASFTVGPAITLTPTEGPSGTVVTIAGRGFTTTADLDVTVTVGGTTAAQVAPIKTLAAGNFTGQFIVPSKATGTYTVTASITGPVSASTSFNVTGPTVITLTPTAGAVGVSVTIEGVNFTAIAGKAVTVTFGAITVLTTSTNATGGFTGTFNVPSLATATYTVTATDANSLTASKTFTIAVTFLGISPVKGPTGTVATVTGYGFTGSTANVTIGTTRVLTNIAVSTLLAGTASFKVPTLPVGNYTVTATDNLALTASTTFEVNATTQLILTPSSTPRGTTVAVATNYFTAVADTVMTFNIRNATWNASLTLTATAPWITVTTNASGSFKGTFTVPTAWALGSYTINASDSNGLMVDASFSVVLATTTLTLNPTESLIGAVVVATGANFQASTSVNIYFGSTLVKTVTSTAGGALPSGTNFTVPDVSWGTYTVNASDGVNSATATFNVLGISGIDTITTIITDIEAKLDEYGSFWNFTNAWFTTISDKLGTFIGSDTVASLLYSIKNQTDTINWTDITVIKTEVMAIEEKLDVLGPKIDAIKTKTDAIDWTDITSIQTMVSDIQGKTTLMPSEIKFDFGPENSTFQTDYIHVCTSTAYSADLGYGWTNTTGLNSRDRGTANYATRSFVFSSQNKTFKVDLPNGNYTVIVTMGDESYAHDKTTITAEGTLIATVSTMAGNYAQKVFTVSVTDGNLLLTLGKATGAVDSHWVINGLVIYRSWNK